MKNKSISGKTKSAFRLIKDIKGNEKALSNDKAKSHFKDLLKHYETTVGLKKEIDLLKHNLKVKLSEIEKSIKKLLKSRKVAKKTLKKSLADAKKHKNTIPDKKAKAIKKVSAPESILTPKASVPRVKAAKKVSEPSVKVAKKVSARKAKATVKKPVNKVKAVRKVSPK